MYALLQTTAKVTQINQPIESIAENNGSIAKSCGPINF